MVDSDVVCNSVISSDLADLVKVSTNVVWTFHVCRNYHNICGHIFLQVTQYEGPRIELEKLTRSEELFGHLDLKNGTVQQRMPRPSRDDQNKPFYLTLHQHFDTPALTIPVVRFMPESELDTEKSVFPIESNGVTLEVKPTQILSPPLVPAINTQTFTAWNKDFRFTIQKWLKYADFYKDINW